MQRSLKLLNLVSPRKEICKHRTVGFNTNVLFNQGHLVIIKVKVGKVEHYGRNQGMKHENNNSTDCSNSECLVLRPSLHL